jgi:Xaa-Pro aminopeptidase
MVAAFAGGSVSAQSVNAVKGPGGEYGVVFGGGIRFSRARPVEIEIADKSLRATTRFERGYESVSTTANGFSGKATLAAGGARFVVEDSWTRQGEAVTVRRELRVEGSAEGGFVSAVTLAAGGRVRPEEVDVFVPGLIYGGPRNLTRSAIGGADLYEGGRWGELRIREDRTPAPLFAIRLADGSSLAVLDGKPDGATTAEDSHDQAAKPMVDRRFRFAAIGARPEGESVAAGLWFPGSEGEVTYSGGTYPGGQMKQWRRRFHPIEDGLTQQYEASFRFGRAADLPALGRDSWRWAWRVLEPRVNWQDIDAVERSLIDMLGERAEKTPDGRTGIPNYIESVGEGRTSRNAILGFTGKNLEAAEFLLEDAARDTGARAAQHRAIGSAIFDSFTQLKVAPPEGEGFNLDTGATALAIPRDQRVYLRSFGDDIKATMRAVKRERAAGREHPRWLAWSREFADWLLTEQQPAGGFPRAWEPGTGKVMDASPASTYNAVPLLVLLNDLTGETRYLDSAVRAAEFAWTSGQAQGRFVGGTIDNPDVIDKEAGTLSLEAYLSLYEKTHDPKWLSRAKASAEYAETYIYIWNAPMPADEDNARLHWKAGVSTVGLQIISTGHSLVDEYMAFDADEFAKLSVYAKDPHYLEVARILLHNTKAMLALPGRTYDLEGPGWQQEHWSIAPVRGFGLHRGWLPWVSTSHLNGIAGLREFDPALFERLKAPSGTVAARGNPSVADDGNRSPAPPGAAAEPVSRAELEAEIRTKMARVQGFLREHKLAAMLLSAVNNFSWITAGLADNHVVITSETGAASLLVAADGRKFAVASNSEMPRLMAEDLKGLGYERKEFKWYEDKIAPDRKLTLIREIAGDGEVGTDTPYDGLKDVGAQFARLRYELTESEMKKYRWLGRNTAEAVVSVCRRIQPGMTEYEMEAMASDELLRRGIRPTVLLMGVDERVLSFRHTVPSGARLRNYAFVNVCARKWGLVTSTGRLVYFGQLPDDLRRRVHASAQVTARFLACTKPGARAGEILERSKAWFAENGFPGEMELHHQGGAIGYAEREWVAFPGSKEVVHDRQAFAWNPIVQGALSFDTFILNGGRFENIGFVEGWPSIHVDVNGQDVELPDILVR